MPHDTSQRPGSPGKEKTPKLGQTVLDDLTRGDFQRAVHRDLEDVYRFYLDEETRSELSEMGQASRWFHVALWVLKNSILRLSPPRRLLLLGGVILFFIGVAGNVPWLIGGFLMVLLILLLELKDKLLAQDELASGRAVQFALMPREHPALPGWETWLFTRPANEVGGDLVDYLRVREDRLGIALGDVAGKGLGAALVMAKLQATLRALVPTFDTLAGLGAQVNKIFLRDGLPSRFVSLVYLEVEPGAGRVRLLNAGHLPPIAALADGIRELPRGAPALGLTPEAAYAEQHITLDPGDLLLVYSDGLTEARNEAGDFFGPHRLAKLLPLLRGMSAEAAGRRLLSALDRFVGEARPSDDLSLVLLRRLPSASEAAPVGPVEVQETNHSASRARRR